MGGPAVFEEAWKETFGTGVIQKNICQFNPSHWQKECFVTKLFQLPPLLNCKMSWDSLMPYVTAWIWTRIFEPLKDSLLNMSIKAILFQNSNFRQACSVCLCTFQTKNQALAIIACSNIHYLKMSPCSCMEKQMTLWHGKHLPFMAQLICYDSLIDFQKDFCHLSGYLCCNWGPCSISNENPNEGCWQG